MEYYIITQGGTKEGPYTLEQLQQMANRWEIATSVLVEEVESGRRLYADQVVGIDWTRNKAKAKSKHDRPKGAPDNAPPATTATGEPIPEPPGTEIGPELPDTGTPANPKKSKFPWIIVGAVLFVCVGFPALIYVVMLPISRNAQAVADKANYTRQASDIGNALFVYAADNDDLLPPVMSGSKISRIIDDQNGGYYIDPYYQETSNDWFGDSEMIGVEDFAGVALSSISNPSKTIIAYSNPPSKLNDKDWIFVVLADGTSDAISPVEFNTAKSNSYVME